MEDSRMIELSPLGKTWILDLDGTILKHNGFRIDGIDSFLPGAMEFLNSLPKEDLVIFITSRTSEDRLVTEKFLAENNVTYDEIIYNAPYGERILINDRKPSGLNTAIAINTQRDQFCEVEFRVNEQL